MKVSLWPENGTDEWLGAKAQGLVELDRLGLNVPPALILRPEGVRTAAAAQAIVSATEEFVAGLKGPSRAWSLRCAAKSTMHGVRILPESVLGLGLCTAEIRTASAESACHKHAAAFLGFFDRDVPAGFAGWELAAQLKCLLEPLLRYFSSTSASPDAQTHTLVIQQMAYGDLDARSLTGICYTRHPYSGVEMEYGHFIVGRLGMALGGVTDTNQRDLAEMADVNPVAHRALLSTCRQLEGHYKMVRQVEFTAEGEELYLLQNTSGKSKIRLA